MNLAIVVPCFDEEDVLPETIDRLEAVLDRLVSSGKAGEGSRVVFVDDGSRDRTWSLIERAANERRRIGGIKLSRNRGHQNALLAGLMTVAGDAVVSIDADLQDDVEVIERMVDRHAEGYDVVYGVRRSRETDTSFKRGTARLFYRLARWSNPDTIADHADFRLMSRSAIEALRGFPEVNLYLRGLVTLVGFRSARVEYDRKSRAAGRTKYPLRKMLAFAWEGISSFSAVPLRMITVVGFVTFVACVLITLWALVIRLFTDRAIPGWASTVLPLYAIGAVQILCIGVLGEYLAKIYDEVKARPRFIIEKTAGPVRSPRPEA